MDIYTAFPPAVLTAWIFCLIKLFIFGDLCYLMPIVIFVYLILLLDKSQKTNDGLLTEIEMYKNQDTEKMDSATQTEIRVTKEESAQTQEVKKTDKNSQTKLTMLTPKEASSQTENAILKDQDTQTVQTIKDDKSSQTISQEKPKSNAGTQTTAVIKIGKITQTSKWRNMCNRGIQTATPFKLRMILYPEPFSKKKHLKMRRKLKNYRLRFNLPTIEESIEEESENECLEQSNIAMIPEQLIQNGEENSTDPTCKQSSSSLEDNVLDEILDQVISNETEKIQLHPEECEKCQEDAKKNSNENRPSFLRRKFCKFKNRFLKK